MLASLDKVACVKCGMCEAVCPMDIFRMADDEMTIAYIQDCCSCMTCQQVCPTDALSFNAGMPKKYNMNNEWTKIKELMGAVEHPLAEETRKPAWMKKAAAGGWNGKKSGDGGWDGKKSGGWDGKKS